MSDQAAFTLALLNADAPAPSGLVDPQGRPAVKRFDVYRNNVALSLTEALEKTFPVIQELVGAEFFAAMATHFARSHPPQSPLLMRYGNEMPAFLEAFEPTRELAYLPDVARLELGVVASYHAADAEHFDGARLAGLAPDDLMATHLRVAPSVRMIRSRWPLYDIWLANTQAEGHAIGDAAQAVLVTRPQFDPVVHLMPPGAPTFVQALLDGRLFGSALQEATLKSPGFDLTECLSLLFAGGAIMKFDEDRK